MREKTIYHPHDPEAPDAICHDATEPAISSQAVLDQDTDSGEVVIVNETVIEQPPVSSAEKAEWLRQQHKCQMCHAPLDRDPMGTAGICTKCGGESHRLALTFVPQQEFVNPKIVRESIVIGGKEIGEVSLMGGGGPARYHASIQLHHNRTDYVLIQGFASSKEAAVRNAIEQGLAKAIKDREAIEALMAQIGMSPQEMGEEAALRG
jgi:hypothetical protein